MNISGLTGHPQFNGRTAVIVAPVDDNGRITLQLEALNHCIRVSQDHVLPVNIARDAQSA